MEPPILFFYVSVIAGMSIGIGCLGAGLYFMLARSIRRKRDAYKDTRRMAGYEAETA